MDKITHTMLSVGRWANLRKIMIQIAHSFFFGGGGGGRGERRGGGTSAWILVVLIMRNLTADFFYRSAVCSEVYLEFAQ